MNVLNVNNTLDMVSGGGTAERTLQMSKFLNRLGARCHILTTDYGLCENRIDELQNTPITILPCLVKRFYVPKFKIKEINNLLDQVDVVHLMNHWSVLNGLIYYFLLFKKLPYVFCPAGALSITGRSRLFKYLYNMIVGKKIAKGADKCIAISQNEIEAFLSYGVSQEDIVHIPNGIDFSDFSDDNSYQFKNENGFQNNLILMFLGRLNHIKGPDLLLEAFSKINYSSSFAKLLFVGPDGGMKIELERMSTKLGIQEDVVFMGYLGGTDKASAYHAADLLIIPSRLEAMSIVVLEAGATATPVLITDQCGFKEIEEIGGGMVVPSTVNGIANGLDALLENKDQLKESGIKLQKFVRNKYSWEIIADKYLCLFQDILKAH